MKKFAVVLVMLISMNQLFAQSNTGAFGGQAIGSGGSASFTAGEVFYTYKTGASGSITDGVQQNYPPKITSFTPASGTPGTLVTITGTELNGLSAFTIGGVTAIVVSNTGETLVGMVMPGAATGTVTVTTSGGLVTSAGTFTVQNTPFPIAQQGIKLTASNDVLTPGKGWSVALSADGTTALVGGYYDDNGVGATWIYTRTGNTWSEQEKLIGTGAVVNAWQGFSVALSADGNTAIVGGVIDNSAWVFTRSGTTWSQQKKLMGSDRVGNAWFGKSVSLSADGNTALVGGYWDNANAGAAWVFTRSGSTWAQQGTKLVATGAVGAAGQGHSVSLSADGNIAAIGGAYDDSQKGATWIFTRSGNTWVHQKIVVPGVTGAKQGQSVALSADATTLIIGGVNATSNVSNAWVYTRSGTTWTQQGTTFAGSDAIGTAANGTSVTLSADGNTAMMGSVSDNNNTGAAWVFTRSGTTWTQQGNKLLGTGAVGTSLYQGRSVSLSANGSTALVGADGDNSAQGAAFAYTTGVVYFGNGNTGGTVPASQLATIGSSVTLATNTGTLVKTGYTFAGWNTLANGAGTSYAVGTSITSNSSLPLYARWTPNNYIVSFNANFGTGTMSNQTIAYNASANLTSNTFTRTGYTFAGWATTTGGIVSYTNGASYTMNTADNVTLYAKWNCITTVSTTNVSVCVNTPTYTWNGIVRNAPGTYTYTTTNSIGCDSVATLNLSVSPNNTPGASSSTPSLCINTALTNITHNTTGATGIGIATGLPIGVTAAWANNTITISGTPTVSGTFNYSIPLTGGCGSVNATGTITVKANNTVSTASSTPSLCINTPLTNITHSTTGATGIFPFAPNYELPPYVYYPRSDEDLGNVTIRLNGTVVLNNTTTINSLSGTVGTASGSEGDYSDFTSFGPYNMYPGFTYSFSLSSIDQDIYPNGNSMAIYIDYNRNGVFTDVGEKVHNASALTVGPHTETGTFTIPATAALGFTRMRVICDQDFITSPTQYLTVGEYEEYSLNIGGALILGLPTGVRASWANNTITISGTPTISGTFNHSIPLVGGCGTVNATGTITVNPVNVSVGAASSTPTICINTSLTNITHSTTGATGIGTATGLPTGVTALWANNKITISGTPTVLGTFNYSIPLVGGCGSVNAIGTISVSANNTTGVASSTPTLCINTSLTNITHNTTGATGIGTATGLPTGVTASWANNTITISGTPTISGTFSYSIALVGGCSSVNATGLITVLPKNIIEGLASSTPRLCINTAFTVITHNTTGATGIGSPNYLPPTPVLYPTDSYDLRSVAISLNGSNFFYNATNINSLSGTIGTAVGTAGSYSDFTAFGPYNISSGSTYLLSLTSITDSDPYNPGYNNMAAYIDYNRNGVFTDDGEKVYASGGPTIGSNTQNVQFFVPTSASPGLTRMRVLCTAISYVGYIDPMWVGNYGEFEDYSINIDGFASWPVGPGVTASWANNKITISGTPTTSGTYNYTIPLAGGCGNERATGTITVITTDMTAGTASSTPSLCINTSLNNITHTTTGASGIGTPTGLPTGVTASWANNTITISGAPSTSGTFNYSIPLTGGSCGSANASGTITVLTNTVGVASSSPRLCMNTALTNITHTTTGATGIGTATGLPTGVTASWATNTITISGTPTASGTFNYTIPLTGGCGIHSATGKIIVNELPVISITGNTTVCTGVVSTLTAQTNIMVPTQSIPLDEVAGARLAVGLRKLRTAYNGSALRLRRSSDNQEQDFGFTGNDLDQYAIAFWLNGASGYCTKLYDQSGNGGHVSQTNASAQPLLVISGINNNPSLRFTTAQSMFNAVNYPAPFSVIYGSKVIGTSARVLSAKNNNWLLGYWGGAEDRAFFVGWVSEGNTPTVANRYNIYAATRTGSLSTVYKNGIQIASNGNGSTGPNGIQLNGSGENGNTTETSNCEFTDVIVYGSALSASEIAQLSNNISSYQKNTIRYLWSTGANSASIAVNATGNYAVTVTDNYTGCSATTGATPVITGTSINTAGNASSTPSLCINTSLNNITHTTTGASGIGTPTGLPTGVTASWANNTITISGTPTSLGTFNYSIPLVGGCGSVNATGTITVLTTIAGAASSSPTGCINTALTNITHTTIIATGIGIAIGLPSGVTASWATNTITISGTPTQSGIFNYAIPLTGGCNEYSATGTITVNVNDLPTPPTISANGATTFCTGGSVSLNAGSADGLFDEGNALYFYRQYSQYMEYVYVPNYSILNLSPFTMEAWVNYSGANVTIIGNNYFSWKLNAMNDNKLSFYNNSISTEKYSTVAVPQNTWSHVAITLSGGTLTFYINGVAAGTAPVGYGYGNDGINIGKEFNGSMDELRIWNVARSPSDIFASYETTVPTNSSGLVAYYKFDEGTGTSIADSSNNGNNGTMVNGGPFWQVPSTSPLLLKNIFFTWYNNAAVIGNAQSISATTAGPYTVKVTLPSGCSATSGETPITVTSNNTAGNASSTPTICINTSLTDITHTTTGASGIGIPTSLPAGVTASWANNTITISGTPTTRLGNFYYSIPLSGGCGSVNATGTITVITKTAGAASSKPSLCINTSLTNITHTTTGATGIEAATDLPPGVSAAWANNIITISGTPTQSGTFNYNIPLTGGCIAFSATGTITVNALPEVSIAGNTTICAGAVSTLTAQSNIIAPTQSIPLDEVAGAKLAIGLRKLRTAYNGPALRLRRSSDDQEQDFGFEGNNLDVNAISTWLNGASAYCTKLYDQSGNGGDVSQTNASAQPLLVISGINNNPTLRFTTAQNMFNAVNYPAPFSVIYGSKVIGTSARVLAAKNNNWLLGYWGGREDRAFFDGWVSEGNTPTVANQYNNNIYAATGTGSLSTVYKNGTQISSNGNGLTGPNGIQLNGAGYGGSTTETSNCEFTDVIVYGSALSASEIAQLSNNISSYQKNPIRYLWSTGANSASIDVNALGNYAVTVTDNSTGCSASSSVTVKRPSSTTNVSICSSATPYLWNGGSYTSSGVYTHTANSTLGCDSIATLNLTINQPSTSSQSVIACESYVWNDSTYVTSGVKTYITTNSVGCDSVAILNLTINQPSSSSQSEIACESYVWNDSTYTTSGVKTYITTNSVGCDSVAILNLTINQPSTSSQSAIACESYVWNDSTYTTSGVKTYITMNSVGCDSVATLNLTINQPSTTSQSVIACESYVWNGSTYTTSCVKTFITTNSVGCDSVAILNLTINQPSSSSQSEIACESYEWNDSTYTTSGVKTYITMNSVGCDSVATLNLTINQPSTTNQSVIACESYEWNGSTYTTSCVKTYITTNSVGCDSVAILNLIINQPSSSSQSEIACESYVWNDSTYTTSGVKTYITTNSVGCDSVAILNLTINQPSSSIETISSPGAYTWHGNTYTSSTITPTWIGVNAVGCDSVVTLHLTITCTPTSSTEIVSACESYLWNSITYTTSGIKTFTTTNAGGCDSTATLNLTINTLVYDTTRAVICESGTYTWSINGADYVSAGTYSYTSNCVTYILILRNVQASSSTTNYTACSSSMPYYWNGIARTSAGTYTYTTPNANGCDSIATLVLTVSTVTPSSPTSIMQTLVSNICGARVYRYSVTAITNAVGYAWTLPSSVGGVSGVTVDSGDVTRDRVIKLKYASNAAAIAGDSIKVRSWSGCGNSAIKVVKLSNAALAVPAAPTALTITAVAPSVCGAKVYRYAAPIITSALAAGTATAAPVTGYQWSFTGLGTTARIDSGDVNSRVIRVSYTNNAAATTGDSVRVSYTSWCGNSLNKSAKLSNVTTTATLVPASITITPVTTTICGNRVYRYSAPNLPVATTTAAAATGYVWSFKGTLGDNAHIDSGDVNSQKIVVSYTLNSAATNADSVKLYYTSSCGNSLAKGAKLTNKLITAPLAPASIAITLVKDSCGARVYRYSAPVLPIATTTAMAAIGYEWSLPTGSAVALSASLDSGVLSGAEARFIRLKFTNNAVAGANDSIRVRYTSGCGNSVNKVQKLSNVAVTTLAASSTLTGTTSICSIVGTSTSARYTTSAVTGAVSYLWTLPSGAVIDSGSNGLKIKIRYITAGPNDSIYVQAVGTNGCAGAKKVLMLVSSGCVTLQISRAENPITSSKDESMYVMVYPNPTTSAYQLFVKSSKLSQTVKARIVDLQGRLIKTLTFNSNETIAFGNELKAGVYMLEVREGNKVKTVRVVKY